MTTHIIYHDFRNASDTTPGVMLTASMLSKGRKLLKTVANVNAALHTACVFFCGACAGVSVFVLYMLTCGG